MYFSMLETILRVFSILSLIFESFHYWKSSCEPFLYTIFIISSLSLYYIGYTTSKSMNNKRKFRGKLCFYHRDDELFDCDEVIDPCVIRCLGKNLALKSILINIYYFHEFNFGITYSKHYSNELNQCIYDHERCSNNHCRYFNGVLIFRLTKHVSFLQRILLFKFNGRHSC